MRSVPAETSEAAVRTSAIPGPGTGTGTSMTRVSPERISWTTCFMLIGEAFASPLHVGGLAAL